MDCVLKHTLYAHGFITAQRLLGMLKNAVKRVRNTGCARKRYPSLSLKRDKDEYCFLAHPVSAVVAEQLGMFLLVEFALFLYTHKDTSCLLVLFILCGESCY